MRLVNLKRTSRTWTGPTLCSVYLGPIGSGRPVRMRGRKSEILSTLYRKGYKGPEVSRPLGYFADFQNQIARSRRGQGLLRSGGKTSFTFQAPGVRRERATSTSTLQVYNERRGRGDRKHATYRTRVKNRSRAMDSMPPEPLPISCRNDTKKKQPRLH